MDAEPTYTERMAAAVATEFGADPESLGEREMVAAQVIVDRRAHARWTVRTLDRARCRPVFVGDPHGILEVLARRWPRPLTLPD